MVGQVRHPLKTVASLLAKAGTECTNAAHQLAIITNIFPDEVRVILSSHENCEYNIHHIFEHCFKIHVLIQGIYAFKLCMNPETRVNKFEFTMPLNMLNILSLVGSREPNSGPPINSAPPTFAHLLVL